MSAKRTLERRIEDYRFKTDNVPADLDELLTDCEATLYTLNRRVRVLEEKLKKAGPSWVAT